jgi:hypothetical protein
MVRLTRLLIFHWASPLRLNKYEQTHNRDQIDRFVETIKRLSVEDDYDWSWAYNSKCKYLNLRFDMRDGGFILTNDEGHRIELPQLEWQWKAAKE